MYTNHSYSFILKLNKHARTYVLFSGENGNQNSGGLSMGGEIIRIDVSKGGKQAVSTYEPCAEVCAYFRLLCTALPFWSHTFRYYFLFPFLCLLLSFFFSFCVPSFFLFSYETIIEDLLWRRVDKNLWCMICFFFKFWHTYVAQYVWQIEVETISYLLYS